MSVEQKFEHVKIYVLSSLHSNCTDFLNDCDYLFVFEDVLKKEYESTNRWIRLSQNCFSKLILFWTRDGNLLDQIRFHAVERLQVRRVTIRSNRRILCETLD